MLATDPSLSPQKRDLHVGGLGSSASSAPAAVIDPMLEPGSWLQRSRMAARSGDNYVRTNPWTALALVALAGLTAGYLLSRRSRT